MTNGSYLAGTSTSGWGFVDPATGYTIEAFFKAPASANYLPILTLGGRFSVTVPLDSAGIYILLNPAGQASCGYRGAGVLDLAGADLKDNEWHHVAVSLWKSAPDTYVQMWVDGVYIGNDTTDQDISRLDQLWIGTGYSSYDPAIFDGQIAHVAIYPRVLTTDRVRAHAVAGLTQHAGEASTDRFQRICRTAGVPAGMYDVDGTGLSIMSAQPTTGQSLLDLVRQCADAEAGVSYVRNTGALALAPRSARYGAPVGLTIDARTQLGADFTLTTDDGLLVNDVTASRPGGATVRVVDNDSVDSYDAHTADVTLYLDSDAQVTSLAEWRVFTASQPSPRCTSVVVDAVAFEANGGDVVELLEADIGTRLSITNLPTDASAASTLDLFIEGVSVRLEKHGPVFTFTTSPVGASGSVWIIEDATYGAVDGDGVIAP